MEQPIRKKPVASAAASQKQLQPQHQQKDSQKERDPHKDSNDTEGLPLHRQQQKDEQQERDPHSDTEGLLLHSQPKDKQNDRDPHKNTENLPPHHHQQKDERDPHNSSEHLPLHQHHPKGKGKAHPPPCVFDLLPREIIQEILYAADPNTFHSLTLINTRWYRASRSARLYAHQLARCGITHAAAAAASADSDDSGDQESLLPALVRLFNEQSRRELFETVLRPSVTEIRLICSASSSAAAFPGGEAFRFEFSPNGSFLLALLSSRIFVLDLSQRHVAVRRELKLSKRPVAAAILDDGSVLAVLGSNHTVTLYDLAGPAPARILRSFALDNEPRTIALSPAAEVLGAAFDGGIAVYSLHPDAAATDRRAVNCDTVDALAFSPDGTILLGTTLHPASPTTTVIVSAQHFSTDMPVEGLAQLWTTQVLFPRSSRDSSHASLLPGDDAQAADGGAAWTFTYDRTYDAFRAVRVDDLRNGHTYFAGPTDDDARGRATAPTTLPSASHDGSLVAAGFGGGQVWVYGIPGKLDLPPAAAAQATADCGSSSGGSGGNGGGSGDSSGSIANTPERTNSNASHRERHQMGPVAVPQWQLLCDKVRNVFIRGRQVGQVNGLAGVKFVVCRDGAERLVTVAGGGVDDTASAEWGGEEEVFAIGGGRVTIYDFARGPRVGSKTVVSVEIGDGIQGGPVETLEEEHRAIEVEVDLARRRTVAARKNASRQHTFPLGGEMMGNGDHHLPLGGTRRQAILPSTARETSAAAAAAAAGAGTAAAAPSVNPLSADEDDDPDGAIDDPYVQGAPRSRNALHRAATVARSIPRIVDNSRYARAVGPDGQPPPPPPPAPALTIMRPGGMLREEDRWEPPPPPYTPRSNNEPPLPAQLLWSLQGPARHPEVHLPAPPDVPPASAGGAAAGGAGRGAGRAGGAGAAGGADASPSLERTRSTIGSVMRRGSIFRLATNNSTISSSRSAPVSPAVSAPPPMLAAASSHSPPRPHHQQQQHRQHHSSPSQQHRLAVPTGQIQTQVSIIRRVSTVDGLSTATPRAPQLPMQHSAPPAPAPPHPFPPRTDSIPREYQGATPPRGNGSVRRVALQETYRSPQPPQPQPYSSPQQPQPCSSPQQQPQPYSSPQQPQPQPYSSPQQPQPQPQPYSSPQQPQPQPYSSPQQPQPQPYSSPQQPQPQPHNGPQQQPQPQPQPYRQQPHQQLLPPPIPVTPRSISPRNSVIVRRNGSLNVVRRPSRAGRSAQINVREAKRMRQAKKTSGKGRNGSSSGGGGSGSGGGGSGSGNVGGGGRTCAIM